MKSFLNRIINFFFKKKKGLKKKNKKQSYKDDTYPLF